jgi:hypothetical protein
VAGELLPSDFEPITVCTLNGKMHSLDNRRLYVFKEAIKRGSDFKTVTALSNVWDSSSKLVYKMKNSQSEDWSKINIRKSCVSNLQHIQKHNELDHKNDSKSNRSSRMNHKDKVKSKDHKKDENEDRKKDENEDRKKDENEDRKDKKEE